MKRCSAFLLLLVMLLGLCACGGTTTTTPPDVLGDETTTQTPADPEIPELPEAPVEEEPTEWDGDYATATFDDIRKYGFGSTKWDGSLPLTDSGEQVEFGIRVNSQVSNYDTNPLTVWLEKVTGVDITFRTFMGSGNDVSTQWSLMFTGGEEMPDLLFARDEGNARRSEYLEAGYLLNVAGYYMTDSYYFTQAFETCCGDDPEMYAIMLNNIYNYAANQQTGQVYGFVDVENTPTDTVHVETMINVQWLEKLGLQKPTTIEELYDVLVAFRDKDPNGNGRKDEVPMMGLMHTKGEGVDRYIINAFIQYAADRKVMIEDGKAFSFHNQDEYRQALIFMNKLVKEGLLSELAITGTRTDMMNMLNFKGGPFPATVGICSAWITADYQEQSEAIHVYEPLPALKDATGRGGYSLFDAPNTQTGYVLTSSCENPQLAWRLLDYMHSPEGYLHQRWGEEGVDWDFIENTEYKDMAEGNGIYGGTARFVLYNRGFRDQSRWFILCTFANEEHFQPFVDPNKHDYANTFYKKSAENVLLQKSIGEPEDRLLVFVRTPEEDELFHEFNAELSSVYTSARSEFILGRRDPNDDAEWQKYLDDLNKLKIERWAEIGQASFDRQQAELEAIRARMGK